MSNIKRKIIYPFLIATSLALVACGGGSDNSNKNSTFSNAEKDFVYNLFNTEYLWFDEVSSNSDYHNYETPQALVDGLKVPQDLWSFTMTSSGYNSHVEQTAEGFGFGYINDFTIYDVLIGSPAYNKLFRGDKILAINNETATNDNIQNASNNIGKNSTFRVLRANEEVDIVVAPKLYTFKVTLGKVFPNNVAYLRYDSFTSKSVSEFEAEFSKFKNAGISDIVIDLRYNGGGSVSVASLLLDNLASQYSGKRQFFLDWNVNYKDNNADYYFSDEVEANDLSMNRIIFLVTKDTASASEIVISTLKPYLGTSNVITIGDYTHGKPVGMGGRIFNNNYYFLINFYVKNNNGEISSFDGIAPTCMAQDDLTHLRGDPEEAMLKSALHYINTNSCL